MKYKNDRKIKVYWTKKNFINSFRSIRKFLKSLIFIELDFVVFMYVFKEKVFKEK